MTGGTVAEQVTAQDHAQVFISAGNVGGPLLTKGNALVSVTGGAFAQYVQSLEHSTINLSGGTIAGDVVADDFSRIEIGGSVHILGSVDAREYAVLDITGGTIDGPQHGAHVFSPLAVAAAGNPAIYLYDNATLDFYGLDLTARLTDPNALGQFSAYVLTGTYADGTPVPNFTFYIDNSSAASYNLLPPVPEPATAALMLPALLLLRRRNRR